MHRLVRPLVQVSRALAYVLVFSLGVPILLDLVLGLQGAPLLGLVTSSFLFQAAAAAVGVSLGLHPALILLVMTSFALGMVLAIFQICDTSSEQSERVNRWIMGIGEKAKKITILDKYGVYSLIFISWLPGLGLYACPVIAWIFGWERRLAVLFILLGWFLASLAVLVTSLGFVSIVF